jgi:ion channel-forming bestrophin family protein
MIVYEPNKNWFRDIWNLTTSWTIQKIFHGVFMSGVVSVVICVTLYYCDVEPRLHSGIFSLLGITLSILLVFRTNTAYDRWWEGRKLWGTLVNNTRQLAIMLEASLPKDDKASRAFLARHISNFGIALKEHLRKGVKLEELELTAEELEELKSKGHKPNHIAYLIYEKIQTIYRAGVFTDADIMNLKQQHQVLTDVMGACERIRKTPIPFSYAVYIKLFISAYAIMLPFGLYTDFEFYSIPLSMFISFTMIGMELMAQEIEDPFGLDCNDLSTGDIANTIKNNVCETLGHVQFKEKAETAIYQKIH